MALRTSLSKSAREKTARGILDRVDQFKQDADWGGFVSRLQIYDAQWRKMLPRKNKPWPGASDYNPPLTFKHVEDIHALLFSFFSSMNWYAIAPAFRPKGVDEKFLKERAQRVDELIKWSQINETNSAAFIDRFVHDGPLYGSGWGEIGWLRETQLIRAEIFIPEELRKADREQEIPDRDLIKAALGEQLVSARFKEGPEEGHMATFIDDDGEEKDGVFWVDRGNPFRAEGDPVVICQRESVTYNAPRSRNRYPWDMLVPGHIHSLATASEYFVRDFLTFHEIAAGSKTGLMNAISKTDFSDLREKAERKTPNLSDRSGDEDAVQDIRDRALAPAILDTRARTSFEVIYSYRLELTPEGFTKRVVQAAMPDYPTILLMDHPLEYLRPNGRNPHFDWHFIPVDGRYHGMGIPEVLHGDQIEENAFYQARSDVLEIITKPGGMYESMSGLTPDEITYKPGMLIKVRSPQTAFQPFVFPVNPQLLFTEQQGIELQAERSIGSTDLGLGRSGTRPNQPRTATGTAITVRQQQIRTDVYQRRSMYGGGERPNGLVEWLLQYVELYQANMSPEKQFRSIRTDEPMVVSRADLQGRWDFIVSFDPDINNPALRAQNAAMRYESSLRNPLMLQNPQALWEVTVDFFEATGLKNARRILPPPIGAADHEPMTQEQEFFLLGKGIFIEPRRDDNHPEHVGKILDLAQDQIRMASLFTPQTLPLLERHLVLHMNYMMGANMSQQLMAGVGVPGAQGAQGALPPPGGPTNSRLPQFGVAQMMGGQMEPGIGP